VSKNHRVGKQKSQMQDPQHTDTRPTDLQRPVRYGLLLLGGVIGLIVAVLGNLIATWVQQDLLQNTFTPQRMLFIIAATVVGVLLAAWLDLHRSNSMSLSNEVTKINGARLSRARLWWSKIKSRGRDVAIHDVSALKSEIDIDTRDHD
jgi:hypothetical protein